MPHDVVFSIPIEILDLIREIAQDAGPKSDGGRKFTPSEVAAIAEKAAKLALDLAKLVTAPTRNK